MLAEKIFHQFSWLLHRARAIAPATLNRAGLHLLEPDDHYTVCGASSDQCACHVKPCGSGSASIVGVVYRDARHAELVEDSLATACISIAEAGDSHFYIIVGNLGI